MKSPPVAVRELLATDDLCEKCRHPFGPHKVFALGESAMDGGVMLCNVTGCDCTSTWSIRGASLPPMPDEETLARLREYAQGARHWDEP